jgi:hypothetical protein
MLSQRLTRKSALRRLAAVTGAVTAYAALGGTDDAEALAACHYISSWPSGTCRTGWGPPSCVSSSVTVYSPNGNWYGTETCTCVPPPGCDCTPSVVQAKMKVCNNSYCHGTCVAS